MKSFKKTLREEASEGTKPVAAKFSRGLTAERTCKIYPATTSK